VTVTTLVGVLVSLGAIVLDQWRYDNDTYKVEVENLQTKIDVLNTKFEQSSPSSINPIASPTK